jgi:hypothetical protein
LPFPASRRLSGPGKKIQDFAFLPTGGGTCPADR